MATATKDEQRATEASRNFKPTWERAETIENEMVDIAARPADLHRDLTDEEETRYDDLKAEHQVQTKLLKDYQEILEMRNERLGNRPPDEAPPGGRAVPPADDIREPEPAKGPFATFGAQLLAVKNAADHGYSGPDRAELQKLSAAATGLSGGVDADGGFLVQKDFAAGLRTKMHTTGNLLAASPGITRVQIGPGSNGLKIKRIAETSRADGSRSGGVRGYWEGEASQMTASAPKFDLVELGLKKLTAVYYATDELLQDAVALEQVVRNEIAKELIFKLEDAIINGDGAGKPLGILNSGALVSIAKDTSQTADTFTVGNSANMLAGMHAASVQNAVWLYNQTVLAQFVQMTLGQWPVFLPGGTVLNQPADRLWARSTIPLEYLPVVGDQNDVLLADLTEYMLIEKEGVQSASSIHLRFLENETAFRFVMRLDGNPMWDVGLTGKDTVVRSPYVVCDVRA